jgi:predicted RND superfamily exporter protein
MIRPIVERTFRTVFRISRYHAWWVLLVTCLITGAGVYYVRDIPIRSSYLDLLPSHDPLIDEYRRNEQYLAQTDLVVLLITLNETLDNPPPEVTSATQRLTELKAKRELTREEEREIEQLTQRVYLYRKTRLFSAAETIATTLKEDEEFLTVSYLFQPSQRIPEQYLPLFTLDAEKLDRIKASMNLVQEAITEEGFTFSPSADPLTTTYRALSDTINELTLAGGLSSEPTHMKEFDRGLQSVISLNEAVLATLEGLPAFPTVTSAVEDLTELFAPDPSEISAEPEGLFSSDRTSLLMTAQPRYPSQRSVSYSQTVMKALEDDLAQIDLEALGVIVEASGNYAFTASTNTAINTDMLRTTIIASVGVFLILFLAFGSIFYSVIAVIPLLMSVVLTMVWAKFALQGFNLVTTFLPALVLGLGIDYAIHLIARYAEERSKGRSLNQALYTSIQRKGEASLIAALTTAFVFLGLLTARSRALFEMGAISGVGVMIAFVTTLFLIPTLITLHHFFFHTRRQREGVISFTPYLTRYFRFVTGKARVIFVLVLTLTFFVTFQAARTKFVFSSEEMIPRVKSQDVLEKILDLFGSKVAGLESSFFFYADSEEELEHVVDRLEDNALVQGVQSAWSFLPVNLSEQQHVLNSLDLPSYIDQLAVLNQGLSERTAAAAQIRTLLAQFGLIQYVAALNGNVGITLAADAIQVQLREIQGELMAIDLNVAAKAIADLQGAIRTLDNNLAKIRNLPPLETLLRDVLLLYPESIRANYITPAGKYIIQASVSLEIFEGNNLRQFDTFASEISDDYFGMPLVGKELEDYMRRDFYVSTVLAATFILLTLWRSLGTWMRALFAATPLVLGYIWMLGGMRLFQIDFNFINITISPLLIGIGVDNAIHLLHRYLEERAQNPHGAIERGGETTAIPVVVTSLTTMLVFGSLLIARTPGLRYLGISALLGIGFTLLFSLLFLPAVLHVEGGKRV